MCDHLSDANPLSDRNIATLSNFVFAHYGSANTAITGRRREPKRARLAAAREGRVSRISPPASRRTLARGSTAVAFLGIAFLLARRQKTAPS